ncbi:uncharacterized protein LOC113562138 [Ooceraea biroi]|uniref:uncharacterized protein LOC113562138 n=1 Tax=Ooceraea biroi TaxID=2015173 RepID=UPI000F07AC64|nr:uncharacterized protein LOC113562138 [Ooceraea biroi]
MRLIPSRLKGHARQWYDTRQNVAISWTETKELLLQHFRKSIPFAKLLREAALYGSVPGQALGDYCFQKLNKLRKLNVRLPDKYLIDAVIGGITDPIVARTVCAAQHADANALYAFMTELDNVVSKSAKSKVTTDHKRERASSSSRRETSQTVSEENTTWASEVSDAKAKHAQIECFNCGKAGHIARKCRKPRVE